MPSQQPEQLRCPKCGGTTTEPVVQYDSYCLRCAGCRENIVAASWIAIGPRWEGTLRVYRDGQEDLNPVVEGRGSDIWQRVSQLASDGTTLVLRTVE